MRLLIMLSILACGQLALAEAAKQTKEIAPTQAQTTQTKTPPNQATTIEAELFGKLEAVQAVTQSSDYQQQAPVVFYLNEAETQLFLRKHYRTKKELVDLASRLSAFGYVELKVGQSYLDVRALKSTDLPSFLVIVKDSLVESKREKKS